MATHIPKLSRLLCSGEIDNFYQQVSSCAELYSTQFDKSWDCGFWILYKYQCRMTDSPECWNYVEVVRGRTCNGELQGLTDRLVPNMALEKQGPEKPENYDGWKCGDLYQPSCKPDEDLEVDDPENRNTYRWWFIRVYDHEVGSWTPFMFDDPSSPNPTPPKCQTCPTDPPPAEKIRVTCGCGNCPELIDMGETESEIEAEELRQRCQSLLLGHPGREQCDCDGSTIPPWEEEPPVPPEVPWEEGGSPDQPEVPQWDDSSGTNWPTGNWGNGETGTPGGAGGGGSGWGEQGSGGAGGGGPVDPTCRVTVKTKECLIDRNPSLRVVSENAQIPLKKQILNLGTNELQGLEDATYFKPIA